MRIYHYFYKQLTPNRQDTFVENEGQSLKRIHKFEFSCPTHRDKKFAYHMNIDELNDVNNYDPSQFRMILESEPGAKVTEKTFKGDEVKKLR